MTQRSSTRTRRPRRDDSRPTRDLYQEVTDTVIAALEAGTVPWHKPWATSTGLPLRMSNRKPYRGVNPLLLGLSAAAKGYTSPWWGTYNMIAKADGVDTDDRNAVRAWTGLRGERATMVVFWKRIFVEGTNEETGKPERRIVPFLRHYNVFNVDQVTWTRGEVPARYATVEITKTPVERITAAEEIVAAYPSPPQMRIGTEAFYTMAGDTITMPPINSFDSGEEYYSTLFHELAHSTGVDSRLNAPGFTPAEFGRFGSAPYSAEELRAELTAALLSATAGLDATATLPNTAAYLAFWLRKLGEEPKLIVQVAARAQRAADFIQGITFEDEDAEE